MKLLISGSSGLIGSAARRYFQQEGHDVYSLLRSGEKLLPGDVIWNPTSGELDSSLLEGFDGIVHLAGENIASGRWTETKKRRIRDSRVKDTTLLSNAISKLKTKPSVFICASAIGFYGNRGEETLNENSGQGSGFLPDVCSSWELATADASQSGVRVVNLRIGIVLTPDGGALAKMLLPFRLGLGGRMGSGKQYMSWISLEDLIRVIDFALSESSLEGPVNAVSPHPVTNIAFSKTLARSLNMPAIAPLPAFLARLALGEMADALLLASIRVHPKKLLDHAFTFSHKNLAECLHSLLNTFDPSEHRFMAESWNPKKRKEVFSFFCDPVNLERITPPWLKFRMESSSTPDIKKGTEFKYRLKIHGLPLRWKSRIDCWEPERTFSDIQVSGPYAKWHHTHRFFDQAGGTLMIDEVRYQLRGGFLGNIIGSRFVRRDVERIFHFRKLAIESKFNSEGDRL